MIYDALVLGGGPAGAVAGFLLAQAGWSVVIVEKSIYPRRKVCGEFISATSLPLFQALGIIDDFVSLAGPEVHQVGLYTRDAVLSSPMPPAPGDGGWGRALGREHLDMLLLNAAVRVGVKLWQPARAVAIHRDGFISRCMIASKDRLDEISARVLIIANGSWERGPSLSLSTAPLLTRHLPSDLLGFKAHFIAADLPADLMPLLVFPGGYGGMVHSDGGRVSLSCCIRRNWLERLRDARPGASAGETVLQHVVASSTGVYCTLERSHRECAWLSAGPIRPGIRLRYQDGMFATGNAAGEAHPIVAEGISMALQSSWLLSRYLIAHQDSIVSRKALDEAGRAYTRAWGRVFAPRIHAAALLAHIALTPDAASFALHILKLFPDVLTWGARLSGKATKLMPAI